MKLLFVIILPAQKYTICITVTISQSYILNLQTYRKECHIKWKSFHILRERERERERERGGGEFAMLALDFFAKEWNGFVTGILPVYIIKILNQ